MFEKVLIANRGEIAVRIIRACREHGIKTVAVYSTADADSMAVRLADESVHIGPAAARHSYLNMANIIGAAHKTGADALHPGYGFLSENSYFAEICRDNGIIFVGPHPELMETMGDKSTARRAMAEAGLPLLPGTVSPIGTLDEVVEVADRIGYPVILKASAGGGGRAITVVREPADLPVAWSGTRATARSLFKNASVYLERYLEAARHIEVQVLADEHGNVVHLGERDCSVQRRHQKLLEEAPSPAVDAELRERIGAAAVQGATAIGYAGAGTMEFLLDEDGQFSFMEMNTRVQVEHPVTEVLTGIDLVVEQLRVAAGEKLSFTQQDVQLRGHAIECRINAEDPTRDFTPTPGRLRVFQPPSGPWVRVDTHCEPGVVISPYYDSLAAKLIVWGENRATAIARMERALAEFDIGGEGMHTTASLHRRVLANPLFRDGTVTTAFLETNTRELVSG